MIVLKILGYQTETKNKKKIKDNKAETGTLMNILTTLKYDGNVNIREHISE